MPNFKNTSGGPRDIPLLKDQYGLEVHVADGETVEIPDEYAAQFDANPDWTSSKTQSPTVTVDQDAAAQTAGIPTEPAPASAAPTN